MSLYDYQKSKEISKLDPPFAAIIMAALRKADDENTIKLRVLWPDICEEMMHRFNAPGGVLKEDMKNEDRIR